MLKKILKKSIPKPLWAAINNVREQSRLRSAERAVANFPTVSERRPHCLPAPLIVSLTSYPKRFPTLAKSLRSLLDQTVRPDHTILWLGYGAKPPADVRALEAHGLEVRFCKDLGPYTKIVPTLKEWPDAYICIADDDVYYASDWLSTLVAGVAPGVISCRRAHRPLRKDGRLAPYMNWKWSVVTDERPRDLFATGCGGVIYPPRSLAPEVLDEEAFLRLCPYADDVWLYMMARKAGSLYRQVGGGFNNTIWPQSQSESLMTRNLNGGNDRQIAAVERHIGGELSTVPDG
jgi:hypothetical protein